MKKILFIFASFLLAGEMEVDGDLTVLGNVNAPGLGGMKPERIYRYTNVLGIDYSFTVPEGKFWFLDVLGYNSVSVKINNEPYTFISNNHGINNGIFILSGDVLSQYSSSQYILNIFEYSASSSGTSQGMDYVEP